MLLLMMITVHVNKNSQHLHHVVKLTILINLSNELMLLRILESDM
jgi:hypothetical protein